MAAEYTLAGEADLASDQLQDFIAAAIGGE